MTGNRHILLAAGGTGGHVFPAIAVAEELMKRGRVSLILPRRQLLGRHVHRCRRRQAGCGGCLSFLHLRADTPSGERKQESDTQSHRYER